MPIESPQAVVIPSFRSAGTALKQITQLRQSNVQPPRLVVANGIVFEAIKNVSQRFIQNCGTNAVYISFYTPANDTNFHFILAGGAAEDDGLGSQIEIREAGAIYCASTSGTHRLATFESFTPEGPR